VAVSVYELRRCDAPRSCVVKTGSHLGVAFAEIQDADSDDLTKH